MGDWLGRTSKEFIPSHSPGMMTARFGGSFVDANGKAQSNATHIYEPNLSAVIGFASKYWTITGDVITLKSKAERDALDAAELTAQRDAVVDQLDDKEDILQALSLALLDEIGSATTITQFKTAVRSKLET